MNIINLRRFESILCCPVCHSALQLSVDNFTCISCRRGYPIIEGVPHFLLSSDLVQPETAETALIRLKSFLRRCPALYEFLRNVCSPVLAPPNSHKILLEGLSQDALIVNLGSGSRRIAPYIVNVDYVRLSGVDIVADVTRLPFKDGIVDGIISEAVLEHVRHRSEAFSEMRRVLRQGGYLSVIVPFLVGYHPSPDDFYRWTRQGLVAELSGIRIVQLKVRSGPTSAFLWIAQEWLAMVLSFNWEPLYYFLWMVLMIATFPLKYLDLLINRHKMAWKIAATFHCIGVRS